MTNILITIIMVFIILCSGISTYTYNYGYHKGYNVYEEKYKKEIAEKEKEIETLKSKSGEVTIETVTKYVDKIKTIKQKGDEIVREVPVYITKEVASKCELPDTVLMLHNSAITGKNPVSESAGIVNEGTSKNEIIRK